ncbi:MAG: serine/threonine protein kinase [Actinomycetia bacterium]|nr:serine/threonine protein kinase [Actinomycetes bacterium]
MGAVYLGRGPDGRNVAVKVVRPELARDAGFVARFQDEVANAQRVASFCTAQVLDHGESDGRAYMVTEFIDGISLLEYVNENGGLSPGMLQGVAVGVAAALVAIHSAGLIHRDLKPANVLLSFSGPRVIDFGIARALDAATVHTMTGQLVGSPGWMAPEQILQQPVTTAVDIFAWGCLVAYAANGINPFGRGDFSVVSARLVHGEPQVGSLPAPLDRLVLAALDKDQGKRPSAKDLLLTMVGGESTEAAVLGTLTPSWQPPASPPLRSETRPADEPTQERHTSSRPSAHSSPPVPFPVPASAPTPASDAYGPPAAEPVQPVEASTHPSTHPSHGVAAASPVAAPTLPAGPSYGGPPTVRPPGGGLRRAALAAAVAVILAGGAVTGWLILASGDKKKPARTTATAQTTAADAAALPTNPLLVRVDKAPGWPKECHGNIGILTPQADRATTLLPNANGCDILPQWSPDGTQIAFTRVTDAGSELWIVGKDGSNPHKLIGVTGKTRVAWSSDSKKIAGMDLVNNVRQIFVITLGQPNPTHITTEPNDKDDPAWCGDHLAFWSKKTGSSQIYTLDVTNPSAAWAKVTDAPIGAGDPAWSRDCKKIAYTNALNKNDRNIWVVDADGSHGRQLTPATAGAHDMDPSWSPQGRWLAFVRGDVAHPQIWALKADGSKDPQPIGPTDAGHPDWY